MKRFCRTCGAEKETACFEMKIYADKKYRRRTCMTCVESTSTHYKLLRHRELALIPDPFIRKYQEPKSTTVYSWEPI